MLFRALRPKFNEIPSHLAEATLPVRIGRMDAEANFARPLDHKIRALGLGQVTGCAIRHAKDGAAEAIEIFFALNSLRRDVLAQIGQILEDMDAPVGSHIEFTETGIRHLFGRTEGLGIFLEPGNDAPADENDKLDLLELFTDALDGDGIYQGSDTLGSKSIMYFYGESFVRMQNALDHILQNHPQLQNAFARRLT